MKSEEKNGIVGIVLLVISISIIYVFMAYDIRDSLVLPLGCFMLFAQIIGLMLVISSYHNQRENEK